MSQQPPALTLPPILEIDGVRRPTVNSAGRPIHPSPEGVRAFWEWFGDSQAVDAHGRPLVLYHGTGGDFQAFDPQFIGSEKYSDWGAGFYFTPSPSNADYYREETAKRTDPVADAMWAQMEALEKQVTWVNGTPSYPAQYTQVMAQWRKRREEVKDQAGSIMPVYLAIRHPLRQPYQSTPDPSLVDQARARGYDGILVLHGDGSLDEIVALEPSQIKSVLGNNGRFNATYADLCRSMKACDCDADGDADPLPAPAC